LAHSNKKKKKMAKKNTNKPAEGAVVAFSEALTLCSLLTTAIHDLDRRLLDETNSHKTILTKMASFLRRGSYVFYICGLGTSYILKVSFY
jgi:hypothetical protein